MKELRNSKQRAAILDYLKSTKSHPTAETIYNKVRPEIPNISLGTVYRNLSLLEELGQIRKIAQTNEPDRFDADTSPHGHLKCSCCGGVSDIFWDDSELDKLASSACGCNIVGHEIMFFGICRNCEINLEKIKS